MPALRQRDQLECFCAQVIREFESEQPYIGRSRERIDMDKHFKRRERRRGGGVDGWMPLGVPTSRGVDSTDAIKCCIHVGFAADPPNTQQLKIP